MIIIFKIYYCFNHFGESISFNLFYGIYNAIDQYYQKQIHILSLILLNLFDVFVKKNQNILQ